MHEKDIRFTHPNLDCVYCKLHNFIDFSTGLYVEDQYAECTNPIKTQGCVSIDITFDGNPLLFETSCLNCSLFESRIQLSLF